jgi:error-prone DNA polymerase
MAPPAPTDDSDSWVPPPATLAEDVWQDYVGTGLSLRAHPLALLRPRLSSAAAPRAHRWLPASELSRQPHGRFVSVCGLVITRQKPSTANGVLFLTLEDETGTIPVIVWRAVQARHAQALRQGRLLAVRGQWQRQGEGSHTVGHLIAGHVQDLSSWLGELATTSRDFQ